MKFLERSLLRFIEDQGKACQGLTYQYRKGSLPCMQKSEDSLLHLKYADKAGPSEDRPQTVTATNRRDIALRRCTYIGEGEVGSSAWPSIDMYLRRPKTRPDLMADWLWSWMPLLSPGWLKRVCLISQSVPLRLVLEECCLDLQVFSVGGIGEASWP